MTHDSHDCSTEVTLKLLVVDVDQPQCLDSFFFQEGTLDGTDRY